MIHTMQVVGLDLDTRDEGDGGDIHNAGIGFDTHNVLGGGTSGVVDDIDIAIADLSNILD